MAPVVRPVQARSLTPLAASIAAALLAAEPARADDKFDKTLDVSMHASFAAVDVPDVALKLPASAPPSAVAAQPRLAGRASLWGVDNRAGFNLSGLRFDVGAGFYGASGLRVRYQGPDDLGARGAWAIPLSASATFAPGSPRWFRPYGGLQGNVTVLGLSLTTINASSPTHAVVAGLSARAGVVFWLSQYFYADLGGSLGLLGADVFSLSAGLGLPIPLANL